MKKLVLNDPLTPRNRSLGNKKLMYLRCKWELLLELLNSRNPTGSQHYYLWKGTQGSPAWQCSQHPGSWKQTSVKAVGKSPISTISVGTREQQQRERKKWPASHFCLGPPTNGEIVLIHIQNSSSKRPRTDFRSEANKVQESKLKQPKGWTGSPGSHLRLLPINVQPEKGSQAKQRTAPGT